MYTLLRNEQVLAGPRDWAPRFFQHFLKEDCNIIYTLPEEPITEPLIFNDSVKLVPTYQAPVPDINPLYEILTGPQLTYDDQGNHVAMYVPQPHDPDKAKELLKQEVAKNRYIKETSPIVRTINGKVLTLNTDRESRNVFFQAMVLLDDATTVEWKFLEGFQQINKADLQIIVSELTMHVQDCFSWEAAKIATINATDSTDALKIVNLTE